MKRFVKLLLSCLLCLCLLPALPGQAAARFYALGEQVEDFTLTTSAGETISLGGLLKNHKAVLLNFWFASCGPCRYEFPFLVSAYEQYKDDVAVLGITPYDQDSVINDYIQAVGITFPMAHDTIGITESFVDYGFPTSVLIDRNGIMCFTECGAQKTADAFVRLFTPFLAEDYSAPVLLDAIPEPQIPDAAEDSDLSAVLNAPGSSLTFTSPEGVWPWLPDAENGGAQPANTGMHDTKATVRTVVTVNAGDALSFRFRTSTEEGYDVLSVLADGKLLKAFSGENEWRAFAVPFDTAGTYQIDFTYTKDAMTSAGEDTAALCGVQLLSGSAAAEALAANPRYPLSLEGLDAALTFGGNAREIRFIDPDGAVAAYYGADGYFIVPADSRTAHIRLGAGCDPDAAFVRDLDGNARTMSHCQPDDTGYLLAVPEVSPELGGNALFIYPTLEDPYGLHLRIYLYFDSAESVDAFCLKQIPDQKTGAPVTNVTWEYAETDQSSKPADTAHYVLRFSDADGAPVKGVIANVCDENTCSLVTSDETGCVTLELSPYPYQIHVLTVPQGYSFDTAQAFTAPEQGGEMAFTLTKE